MNKAIAKKWVNALRSGKYKQASGRLRRSDVKVTEFCCLGVLCDLYPGGTWSPDDWFADGTDGVDGEASRLPTFTVRDWTGVNYDFVKRLANENDAGKSFSEIASMIEKEAGL